MNDFFSNKIILGNISAGLPSTLQLRGFKARKNGLDVTKIFYYSSTHTGHKLKKISLYYTKNKTSKPIFFFGKKKPTIKNWNLRLTYKSSAKSVFISRRRTIYLLVFSLYTLLLFLKMMNAHNEIPASRHHHGFETFRTF